VHLKVSLNSSLPMTIRPTSVFLLRWNSARRYVVVAFHDRRGRRRRVFRGDETPRGGNGGSNETTKSAFESLFEFVATNDDTPYFCVPAALEFRKTMVPLLHNICSKCCGNDIGSLVCQSLQVLVHEHSPVTVHVQGGFGSF
jgi:hypothetical protein